GDPGVFATATNLVRQADGKFVIASSDDYNYRVLVGRLNADGTPDTTFGQGGVYAIPSPNAHQVRAIAVQADGKVLLGGDGFSVPSGQSGFIIDRLTADGKPDPTFGQGGEVVVGFSGNDRLSGLAVLPAGDI